MEGYMSHLNPGNFPKKRPLKLVEPSRLKRSMHREQKKDINSGIAFGIVGLDGTKRGWVVNQILMEFSVQLFRFLFVCSFVFAFSPDFFGSIVLTQACLKDPFPQHKLDEKADLDLKSR